ncbi:hypothetical protein [Burkholderia sp. AU6039]|uniref:hypothetical protein n=1 Tax=Burkholderia sp. AU6039 TaxID=2015344 RepID=UPI00117EC291|nr:hypothetical protein [Burkholderia sp. AU6039]
MPAFDRHLRSARVLRAGLRERLRCSDVSHAPSASRASIARLSSIVGFTFTQLVVHLPLVIFMLWALASTLSYHPPVMQ